MSFGFSIGDFLAVLQIVKEIREQFVDASKQYKAISNELECLSAALENFEIGVLKDGEKAPLHQILSGCKNVLIELRKELGEHKSIDDAPKGISNKSRKILHRLKWDEKKIEHFRSRINAHVNALNTFNINHISRVSLAIRDSVGQLTQHQEDRERQLIESWLTTIDYHEQQRGFIATRQGTTGAWLLISDQFQAWFKASKSTLYCPGIPRAGKTIMSAIVIDHLLTIYRDDLSVGIAFLYCNYRQQQEQTFENLLLSILKQLLQRQPSVPTTLQELYKSHKANRSRPSTAEIKETLLSILQSYSKVFIVVDALDECLKGSCDNLLSSLFDFQDHESCNINIFATSRPIPEIVSVFATLPQIELRAEEDDILGYVDARMPELLRSRISQYPDLQDSVRSAVSKATNGMFLLARLHMDALSSKSTRGDIKLSLKDMPRGVRGLDTMYERAMHRIESQEEGFRSLAKEVLSWLTHARRPLTTIELQHALAVKPGMRELDEDFLPEVEDLVSICAGLVTLDEEIGTIRWIHYTTQDFFDQSWRVWMPRAQQVIAETCLTYLSFNDLASGPCPTDDGFKARLQQYKLFEYAALNWGHHCHAMRTYDSIKPAILDLLTNDNTVSGLCQAIFVHRTWLVNLRGYSQWFPRDVTGMHLAAHFGLVDMIPVLVKEGLSPDGEDRARRIALISASRNEHEEATKAGLKPDSRGGEQWEGRTPLSWAADSGHLAVVKLLLEECYADLNLGNILYDAVREGYEELVKLLLAQDSVDPNSRSGVSWTPLSYAASSGNRGIVNLLLARDDVDPNSVDTHGQTPLLLAVKMGHEEIVAILLARDDVDPDLPDGSLHSPLMVAAEMGHEGIVKLLLTRGDVDPDSKDFWNNTPLFLAVREGHERVVELLLATKRVDPNAEHEMGDTPLLEARNGKHEGIVKLLQQYLNSEPKLEVKDTTQLPSP